MSYRWLDANIFLRYLTGDDPVKAQACLRLFQRLKFSLEQAETNDVVIAEVIFVLSSKVVYNLPRQEVAARLRPALMVGGLKVVQKPALLEALDLYGATAGLDFSDALLIKKMESSRVTELYSYDTDFDRFPEIKRLEPQEAE